MVAGSEDIAGTIRRLVARETELSLADMTDDFRWIDHATAEDVGWFLGEVERQFGCGALFDGNPDTDRIATVGGLIAQVEEMLRQS